MTDLKTVLVDALEASAHDGLYDISRSTRQTTDWCEVAEDVVVTDHAMVNLHVVQREGQYPSLNLDLDRLATAIRDHFMPEIALAALARYKREFEDYTALHVFVANSNVGDSTLALCRNEAEAQGHHEGVALCDLFLTLTYDERVNAWRDLHGYHPDDWKDDPAPEPKVEFIGYTDLGDMTKGGITFKVWRDDT